MAHCILGKFLGVGCHSFPPPLDVPTFSARCLHVQRRERHLVAEGGTLRGRETFRQIPSRIRLPHNSRDLLNAANLQHWTDGFTSPPKEGVLRIFFALKNPTSSAGFEPTNLGTKGQHATSRPPKSYRASKYYQVFLFVQLNAQLDHSRLKLTLKFTLKCSYMFRLTNHHQGAYCCALLTL
jgi:hypothetical protein